MLKVTCVFVTMRLVEQVSENMVDEISKFKKEIKFIYEEMNRPYYKSNAKNDPCGAKLEQFYHTAYNDMEVWCACGRRVYVQNWFQTMYVSNFSRRARTRRTHDEIKIYCEYCKFFCWLDSGAIHTRGPDNDAAYSWVLIMMQHTLYADKLRPRAKQEGTTVKIVCCACYQVLEQNKKEALAMYKELSKFYGEDELKPDEFMTHIHQFAQSFKEAYNENLRKREEVCRVRRREWDEKGAAGGGSK